MESYEATKPIGKKGNYPGAIVAGWFFEVQWNLCTLGRMAESQQRSRSDFFSGPLSSALVRSFDQCFQAGSSHLMK